VSVLAPVGEYVWSLVHPTARRDALTAARHRAFIAPRLLGGLAAFAILPVQLATRGIPSPVETVVLGWMIMPTLAVYYLSRTGRIDHASILCSVALTALLTAVAAMTGGLASIVAAWLVIVPLEASLSASRRVVLVACGLAAAAAGLLSAFDATGLLPVTDPWPDPSALFALGAALAYATGLALGAGSPVRVGHELRSAEEARYRLLAGNMTDVIVRHGRNGAILFVSPAAERVIGVPVEDLRGHLLFDRIHVTDRPAYLKALSEAAMGGQSRSVEFRILQGPRDPAVPSHPRFIWLEMRCRPLDSAGDGKVDGAHREVVSVLRDVTERKDQEQVVEDARLDAERANAAKSRFLATMSHELRTPLNAIIGFSDMLINEHALNIDAPRRRDYAQLINGSGQHLLAVVNGILDMSRIETGNFQITPEPFSLGPVIANCCELLALDARESEIDLVFRHPEALPEIVADKRAVKQVLLNLLSNALKFTGRGGRVSVSAKVEQSVVVIEVEDTGVGISETDLQHLGDPFFQVRGSYDRPHEGTGLGLSIVKGLVGLHGGRMDISSRVGKGTRVVVSLPFNGEGSVVAARPADDRRTSIETLIPAPGRRMKKRA